MANLKGKTVTCLECGWVHMEVSRDFATKEVESFNDYFNKLSKEEQSDFYNNKRAGLEHYDTCQSCGGSYKNFRDSKPDDCLDGGTIGAIISRLE